MRIRLCSSGIDRLNDRGPASKCVTRMSILTEARPPRSSNCCPIDEYPIGVNPLNSSSNLINRVPVCRPWLPDQTPKPVSGGGRSKSDRKLLLMFGHSAGFAASFGEVPRLVRH